MHSTDTVVRLVVVVLRLLADSAALVRGVAFWTAVLLPLVFLWLLVDGSPLLSDPVAVLGLTAVDVACLVLGHGYGTNAHHHD